MSENLKNSLLTHPQTLSSIKPAVSDILRNSSKSTVRFHDDVLASSMAACVGEMTNTVAKSEGTLDAAQSSGDLPLVSGFLVGVVSSNKELLRLVGYQEMPVFRLFLISDTDNFPFQVFSDFILYSTYGAFPSQNGLWKFFFFSYFSLFISYFYVNVPYLNTIFY